MEKMSYSSIKTFLISVFSREVLKASLKYFLGTAAGTGIKAWLIKKVVTEFSEEIAAPIINATINEIGYQYEKINGRKILKRIESSQSQDELDSAIDDIYKLQD